MSWCTNKLSELTWRKIINSKNNYYLELSASDLIAENHPKIRTLQIIGIKLQSCHTNVKPSMFHIYCAPFQILSYIWLKISILIVSMCAKFLKLKLEEMCNYQWWDLTFKSRVLKHWGYLRSTQKWSSVCVGIKLYHIYTSLMAIYSFQNKHFETNCLVMM